MATRVCTRCGNSKEESAENFYIRRRGGWLTPCKSCIKLSSVVRYAEATDVVRKANNARYAENKVEIQAKRKSQRESSLHFKLSHMLRNAKQRALKKGWEFDLDIKFLKDLYEGQGGRCFYTLVDLTFIGKTKMSIDRIDSDKGYTKDNVRLVTYQINILKRDANHVEFVELCKLVGENF